MSSIPGGEGAHAPLSECSTQGRAMDTAQQEVQPDGTNAHSGPRPSLTLQQV